MSSETLAGRRLAAELRREFDNSFAALPEAPGEARAVLLNIRVAGEPFAVRTQHITGLVKRNNIVPIPTSVPGLVGIMALRGGLLPVYDLAAMLGLPASGRDPGWLILAKCKSPLALCFEAFEGQLELDRACLYEREIPHGRQHLGLIARMEPGPRAVIDIPGIVTEIQKSAGLMKPAKE